MNLPNVYGFTVLTPTYNRAHTLERVYQSLQKQDFADFEWLIIDDGSTDHTNQLVTDWINEKKLPIRYIWQQNQHKKIAVNNGVANAQGQLIVILDSDDELTPNALSQLWQEWNQIPERHHASYISITGLCASPSGQIIGDKYPQNRQDMTSLEMYFRYHPAGEKFGCLNAAVLRKFPYPNIDGFVPESLIWRKIARHGFKTRFVNVVYRIYHETQAQDTSHDSLSQAGKQDPRRFAMGYVLLARDTLVECKTWFLRRPSEFFKAAVRYSRFKLHMGQTPLPELARLKGFFARFMVCLTYPFAYILYCLDNKTAK
ncbi:glycosyltransferase family 2 protein [Brackiella oedipodis]|uniref:glycosyltransferase family 2 protein n=1 Tax=Brackiella oedipodis TaxID=124225 RepID=UPI0012EB8951|nr:glycosyltransferase family 2 protein [Brackiella oedipodis]